jgi:hypothetical protein
LLNEYALNAAFKVPILLDQKLIRKNEVIPIISHPKNITIKLPELTNKTMLNINKFKNKSKRSTRGSYRKYEKVKI